MPTNFIKSIMRSSMGIMLSRVFGLLRDITIAAVYGASGITDIFFVAFAIPNLFRQFFAEGALASAFVPFLADKKRHHGNVVANTYLTQLIVIQVILITIISIIIILLAPYIIMLFVPGLAKNPEYISTGATILRIVIPYLLFVSMSGMLAGFLNISGSYFVAYASTAILNIMMIIGAIIGYYQGGNIYSLAISVFVGGFFQFIIVLCYAYYQGFRLGALAPFDMDIKKTYLLLIPSIAGVGISQLNFLVGRIIASFLEVGSISWLFYANRLFQFPLGVFSVSISTVGLTELSKARALGDHERYDSLIDKSIIALLMIIIPATIGLVGLSFEITDLVFARRAFTLKDTINTAMALQMYSIGLLFYSFVSVLTRVFHSDKNTKTPVKCAAVAFVVNIVLNIILMKPMGHAGIALASSVAALINCALLYVSIKGYSFSVKKHSKTILKIILGCYSMIICLIIFKYLGAHVLVNIACCVVVYCSTLILLGIDLRRTFR